VENLNSSIQELKEENSAKGGEILDLCKNKEDLENLKIDLERQISEQLDMLNKSSDRCDSLENEVRSLQTKINKSEEDFSTFCRIFFL
jgi:predicted HicB family RNase H-like nuclease